MLYEDDDALYRGFDVGIEVVVEVADVGWGVVEVVAEFRVVAKVGVEIVVGVEVVVVVVVGV